MYSNDQGRKSVSYYVSLPSYYLDKFFRTIFYYIGYATATAPILFIVAALIFTAGIGVGIKNIQLITDPQGLWVPPDSDTVKQKNYFDDQFSPFFRIEQMIIFPKNLSVTNAINRDMFNELFEIQKEIDSITVYDDGNCTSAPITLDNLCYKPIPSKGCMIQSPLQFYQMKYSNFESQTEAQILSHVFFCIQRTSLFPFCMADIGIPLYDKQMFGKVAYNATTMQASAQALIVTLLLNNDNATAPRALKWEKEFLKIARKERVYSTIYVSAERSVQDELADETSGDISTVLISYAVMFVYVAISLGQIHPIKSRIVMGLAGVIIVVMSIIISAGICCLAGVPATLIIMEVMPFLILAIGVDNMFIMANHLDQVVKRKGSKLTVAEAIAETMGTVGSSMTLASISEFLAFMLGSLTKMPAVQAFCIYSGVAIIANFVLQVTCFSALLSLDLRRRLSNRLELEPTIVVTNKYFTRDWISIAGGARFIMKKVIAPIVTFVPISSLLILVFLGLSGASIYASTFLSQGLDQITALPTGSYLGEYFLKQRQYVDLGPPVYYVTKSMDYTSKTVQDQMSRMMNVVAETEYLDRGSILFFYTDFKKWVLSNECSHKNISANHVPPEFYVEWLKEFLNQEACCEINHQVVPLCGFQFREDVRFSPDGKSIQAARLMTQTKTLITQEDFINSMKSSYYTSTYLADPKKYDPTSSYGPIDTYPYSIYYIYFAQYLYLPEVSAMNIMIASGAVFLTTLILLGSPVASIYVLICISMILTNLLGIMAIWGIYVNALSVVNLVMSIGISVEFCVHITRAFMKARGSHKDRVKKAMIEMGSSVLSGITFTKFIGVVVLAFSHSEIFRIYYFKMYLSIVVSGALHGLLFLPSLLLIAGPQQDPVAKLKGEEDEAEDEEPADVNIEGRAGFINPHIHDDDEDSINYSK